jgi:hypothetical protein
VAANAASPFWVGTHTSQRSGVYFAVAFIGSIGAWFWNGYAYTASTFFVAPARAALTSPFWLRTNAWSASRPAFRIWAMLALDTCAFGPSSHTIGSASSAVLACHHVSATTATAVSPTCTTCLTPGMPLTLSASKLFTFPPNTGHSLMLAFSMPGSFRSAP